MKLVLLVGVLATAGAFLRWGLVRALPQDFIPLGTLLANALGSVSIGLVYAWTQGHPNASSLVAVAIPVGLLGALTTFSGFALETYKLAVAGQWALAFTYLTLTNVLCLAGCWWGHQHLIRWI